MITLTKSEKGLKIVDNDLLDSLVDGFLQDLEFEFDLSGPEEAAKMLQIALERRGAK